MANIKQLKLPDNTTYDLKDESGSLSSHWHHDEDLKPLVSKTYASTSYYATANNYDNATWYFMSVKPDAWYKPWRVKFKVKTSCPNQANWYSYTWATYCGRTDGLIYANWNEQSTTAHTYITFYPLKQAGFNAGYGHAIGVSIYNGNAPTTANNYRTFEVDYYECENCTVTILDTPVKWASWPGTGTTNYGSLSAPNASSRGLQESGDSDTYDAILVYFGAKTGAQGIWAGSLFMQDGNKTYQNICTASDGTATNANRTTATTKLANANGFLVGGTIYYSNANYNANTNISSWGSARSRMGQLFDARYSFNVTLTANSLTPYAPVYLVGTINSTDGLFYLDQVWWTQTPNATDKIYILVGGVYDSTTSNCRMVLYENNPWYKYDGSKLVELTNGHIVNKDVPADAVFTDTTYESKQEAQGGTDLSLVTTGEKYAWNHNAVVNNGTLTIKQNGTTQGTFTANQSEDAEVELTDTTYESLPESNGGNDVSLVKTGDKYIWNRTFPFRPGVEVSSLDDLVNLMNYNVDKRCYSGVIKISSNIGIGVTGWRRVIAIAQNAVNNGTYDIGMFCVFFPADTSDFVNYALIDGKTTGNYSVSKTGQFVTNVFASTVQITTAGNGQLNLGNNLASGVTGKSRGRLVIFSNTDTHYSDIRATGLSDDRNLFCPDKSGTIAVTSDITDEKVKITHSTSNNNYPICFEAHNNTTTYTTGIYKTTKILINPATGDLKLGGSGGLSLPHGGGVSNLTQILRLSASNESDYYVDLAVKENAWCFAPAVTKKLRLGSPNYLWTTVYAQTGSINTSDRNEKKDIVPLDESAKDFIMALNPVSYKFKDGESGRTHYGMIAQDVEQEMAELGMTAMDFAGFCKDQKTISYETKENGQTVQKDMPVEGQYTYGLRYEEFMAPAIKTIQLLQNQVDEQQQEINELKQQLAEIKAMLNGGN